MYTIQKNKKIKLRHTMWLHIFVVVLTNYVTNLTIPFIYSNRYWFNFGNVRFYAYMNQVANIRLVIYLKCKWPRWGRRGGSLCGSPTHDMLHMNLTLEVIDALSSNNPSKWWFSQCVIYLKSMVLRFDFIIYVDISIGLFQCCADI